jgi:hypothetical protein
MTAHESTELYVITYDANGNYRVHADGLSAPIWRDFPTPLHHRRQEVQGRFKSPADAVHRAVELADMYSQVKG